MEENPFQPPRAEVKDQIDPLNTKRSYWWKVYLIFTLALSGFGFASFFSDPAAGAVEYFYFVIWLVATVGLAGFIFSRPILSPKFWFIILLAYLAYSILYYYVANIDLRLDMTDTEYFVNNLIGWILSLPAFIGLYLYSQPDERSWAKLANSDNNDASKGLE